MDEEQLVFFCFFSMTCDDLTILQAGTGFSSEIAPTGAQCVRHSRPDETVFKDAAGGKPRRCRRCIFTKDVVAKGQHGLISTFNFSESPKAATQQKDIAFDVLAWHARGCKPVVLVRASGCVRKRWCAFMECFCQFTSSRWPMLETFPSKMASLRKF